MSQLTHAERREFLKSMDIECQTLLKNQAAKVLSLEGTAQARERWRDRAMDTRWARICKPSDSMASGRRAAHDSSLRVSQILTSSTLNHILRRSPGMDV